MPVFPRSVHTPDGTTCDGRACVIRLAAEDSWKGADGVEHRILLGVAEVKDDCHACEAIMGIGEFSRAFPSDTWQKGIVTPAVTRVGGYGLYGGKIYFADGGPLGRIVMFDDADGGQGTFTSVKSFVIVVGNAFKEVLMVPLSITVDGSCDDKEADCRQKIMHSDYDSQLTVGVQTDGLLHIDQVIKAAIPVPPASWVIDKSGVARQTSGGKVSPGGDAQERAMVEPAAYSQGRADRLDFDTWFKALSPDMRAGAESWAGRRSLRVPGSCELPPGQTPDWAAGCTAARDRLAKRDARRKSEPDYKRGWNSL